MTQLINAFVYIDGFNLYHCALRHTPYRWLNPKAVVQSVLGHGYNLARVNFYTARVSSKIDKDAPAKQAIYIKALQTVPEINIHHGKFLVKDKWRGVAGNDLLLLRPCPDTIQVCNPDEVRDIPKEEISYRDGSKETVSIVKLDPKPVVVRVRNPEEKGSDVNLGVHLVRDAFKMAFDEAIVVTNDTDLVEPIRIVKQELNMNVTIVSPAENVAGSFRKLRIKILHIRESDLKRSQFPDQITGTNIRKPPSWVNAGGNNGLP